MTKTSKFLKVAKNAALKAGKIIAQYQGLEHKLHDKGRLNDFATQADLEAERIITDIIKSEFPEHGIIAEESGEVRKDSEYKWAIDPIDGTIGFVTGMPVYAVSIGLLKNNQPIVGVVLNVALNELYWAEKNGGAFVNGIQIQVSGEKKLANSSIGLELGHTDRLEKLKQYFEPLVGSIRYPYVLGGAAMEMAYVARGFLDGHISRANIWDYAGGAIIVKEAGGKVTNHQGQTIDWTNKKIYLAATNGSIHNELLKNFNKK